MGEMLGVVYTVFMLNIHWKYKKSVANLNVISVSVAVVSAVAHKQSLAFWLN